MLASNKEYLIQVLIQTPTRFRHRQVSSTALGVPIRLPRDQRRPPWDNRVPAMQRWNGSKELALSEDRGYPEYTVYHYFMVSTIP